MSKPFRRHITAVLLVVSLLCTAATPAIFAETEHAGAVADSVTWSGGDTVKALEITGGTADAPVVVDVSGTVRVEGTISVTSGHVLFRGGGTLLRAVSGFNEIVLVKGGATVTLENITLDGNNRELSPEGITSIGGPLSVGAGGINATVAEGHIILNEGAIIQNNYALGPGNVCAGIMLRGDTDASKTTLTMNGGAIRNNYAVTLTGTSGSPSGVHSSKANVYINGGSITGNTGHEWQPQEGVPYSAQYGIYMRSTASSSAFCEINPVNPIAIDASTGRTPYNYYTIKDDPNKTVRIDGEIVYPSQMTFPVPAFGQLNITNGAPPEPEEPSGGNEEEDTPSEPEEPLVGNTHTTSGGALTVNHFANYGGSVTVDADTDVFTVAAEADGYVIDTVCVDGIPLTGEADPRGEKSITYAFPDTETGTHSIVAAFAYTLSFSSPANGTLSVSRVGGNAAIESGEIVRGGDILRIQATPDPGYELDTFTLVGLRDNEDGTYTVYGREAPSISAVFKESAQAQAQEAAAPRITVQPQSASYAAGGTAAPLSVTASVTDGGTLGYTWYRNTVSGNTGGSLVQPARATAAYTPNLPPGMTYHYYCVVTNTLGESKAEARSESAAITVAADTSVKRYKINGNKSYSGITEYTFDVYVNGTLQGQGLAPGSDYVEAEEGNEIRVTLAINDGNVLTGVVVATGLGTLTPDSSGGYSFTMPARAMTLYAVTATIKTVEVVQMEHGSVSTDAGERFTGGAVIVTATPEEGYRVGSISYSRDDGVTWEAVTGNDGNPNSFTTTAAKTLVTAEFVPADAEDFVIRDEAALRTLAAAVNAGDGYSGVTLTLDADITLTEPWTPIGTESAPFMGHFDGRGHSIDGLAIDYTEAAYSKDSAYLGLFGYALGAEIKALTVRGTVDESASDPSVISTSGTVGGIVGHAASTRIADCVAMVDVLSDFGDIGGIVGYLWDGSVSNCLSYGTLSIRESGSGSAVGGVVGYLSVGSVARSGNYGAISVTGTPRIKEGSYQGVPYYYKDDLALGNAGGVVGTAMSWSSDVFDISHCFNKGDVSGWAVGMGGLLGRANSGNGIVTDCYNTGAVRMTVDNGPGSSGGLAYTAGLVGDVTEYVSALTLANSYNAGTVESAVATGRGLVEPLYSGKGASIAGIVTATNCFAAGAVPDIAMLGDAFKADANSLNGGLPLLAWEADSVSDERYAVTFAVSPAGAAAAVHVYADAALTREISPEDGGAYALQSGQYHYLVQAEGYVPVKGGFNVAGRASAISVALRAAARVTFRVTPADASLTLNAGAGGAVAPESASDGLYDYLLYAGDNYIYTASADGYNAVTRTIRALDGASHTVALTQATMGNRSVKGGDTITEGGVYNVTRGDAAVQGTITISTTDPVTLVGGGLSEAAAYADLHLRYTTAGADLTLRDIFIHNTNQSAGVADNLIDFMGAGNKLYFEGTSILDHDMNVTGYAMIHVPEDAELTFGGANPEDTLYLYKHEQGACIGGNTGEYNGRVTFTQGRLFAKNSKQGALIGAGSGVVAVGTPGDIILEGGEINLIAVSRSAALGGGAGHGGVADGTNVYIHEGVNLGIYVDFSGAAIGGGGYAEGNDSDGGVLHYTGGSIRVYIAENAINPEGEGSLWPEVTEAGVNDAAITALKRDEAGRAVHSLVFDTRLLGESAGGYFEVRDETGAYLYRGGPHAYGFVNAALQKDSQVTINFTVDNWVSIDDPNLYLYLPAGDHVLTVNGRTFSASWNADTESFTVLGGARHAVEIDAALAGGSLHADRSEAAEGETVTVSPDPAPGHRFVTGSLLLDGAALTAVNGVYGFTMPGHAVLLTARFEAIPAQEPQYAVEVAEDILYGTVTPDLARGFDGQKVTLSVTPDAGHRLVPGSLKANGAAVSTANGAYFFLIAGGDVTVTADFEPVTPTTPSGSKFKAGEAAADFVLRIPADFSLYDASRGLTLEGPNGPLTLPAGTYEVREGSTIVTIFRAYLDTLPQGDYSLRVPFTDGSVVTGDFALMAVLTYEILSPSVTGGSLAADRTAAEVGARVTVTVTPAAGYRLAPGSLKYGGIVINADAEGKYAFEMPAWDVTLTAEFIEAEAVPPVQGADEEAFKEGIKGTGDISAWVWDGKSIDITWFDPAADTHHIKTPAQLAGLAALVNGLYNREIDTVAGKASYIQVNTGL
ncbi:MAG: hypothetical protein LBD95_03330, partial [Clostridiales Family XIII bacterium]|nr:hypothetical protein [Clostridiales Family XIII bacterium]